MECWECERPAHAICRFCGRGVCKQHAQEKPYIVDIFHNTAGQHKAVVVGKSVWCGICEPQEDPVEMQNLG